MVFVGAEEWFPVESVEGGEGYHMSICTRLVSRGDDGKGGIIQSFGLSWGGEVQVLG